MVAVPQDHLKPAAQREVEKAETTDVEWRGHTFTVPTDPDDWPVEAVLAFEGGQFANGMRATLSAEHWAEFMKTKPVKRDIIDLFDAVGKTLGMDGAGN